MRQAQHPFWRYSLRTYRKPGVEPACLALQERCRADVNMLLFCCWIGHGGRTIERRRLRQVMARVGAWQAEVIQPLRNARRAIKIQPPRGLAPEGALRLRHRIAALELAAEQIEQSLLADQAALWPAPTHLRPPRHAVAANLERYLLLVSPVARPEDLQPAAVLAVHAC